MRLKFKKAWCERKVLDVIIQFIWVNAVLNEYTFYKPIFLTIIKHRGTYIITHLFLKHHVESVNHHLLI